MDSKSSPADQANDAAVEEKEVVDQEVTDKDAITKLDTSELIETFVIKSEQNLEDKSVVMVEVMTAPEENSKAPDSEVHAVNGWKKVADPKEEINMSTPPEPATKIITDDESKNTENISGAIEAQNKEASETPAVPTLASETETKLEELPSAYTENRSTETSNGKELVVEDKSSSNSLKEDSSPSKIEGENKRVEEAVAIESSEETIADAAECKTVEVIPVPESVDAPKEADKVEEPVKEVTTGDVFSDPSASSALTEVTDVTPVTGSAEENGNSEHIIEEEKKENSVKDEEPILITEDKIGAIAVGKVPEVPSEEVKTSEGAVLVEETKDDETTLDASSIVVEASTVGEKTTEGSEVVETKDESLNDEKTTKAYEEAVQDLEKKDENLEGQAEISTTVDASSAVVESSTGQEKTSECTESVKEIKDESPKDDNETISVKASEEAVSEGQEEIPRNLDAPTIVAEVSIGEEKISESTEIVKETKDESSKDDETTLDASATVVEASAEEEKTFEGSEIVETKYESLNDEKTSKVSEEAVVNLEKKDENLEGQAEISANPDASSVVVESSTGEEKTSECTESVQEIKDESPKDDHKTISVKASEEAVSEGQEEISRNLDSPTIVAEVSIGEEKTSEITEIVDETTLDASATVVEASAEEEKTSEGSEIVETKYESLNDEKTTKASEEAVMDLEKKDKNLEGQEEISANPDASSVVVGSSTGEEKTSECTETVKEIKEESSKVEEPTAVNASEEAVLVGEKKDDEHVEGLEEISTNLDAPTIVAEVSTGEEKISESTEIVKETTDEISKDGKTTLVDASAVDTATQLAKISSEEKKDLEDHSTILDITANDSDVTPAAEVAPQEEKISEGDELVGEKKKNEAKALDPVEKAKELDVKERNTPAAFLESTDCSEGAEKHKEAVEDNEETQKLIETKKDGETAAKQDAPVKPSQRHSNNIISKVKHSIVKVKKAIIGKSPSSKTMSTGDKNDIKVK